MKYNSFCAKKFMQKTKTVYNNSNGLPSDNITALAFSSDGTLFIGTDNGLAFYRDGEFKGTKYIVTPVKSIFASRDGKVFVSSDDKVYVFEGNKVIFSQQFKENVVEISADLSGKIWLITDCELWLFKDGEFECNSCMEFGSSVAMAAAEDSRIYVVNPLNMQILHGKRPSWSVLDVNNSHLPTADINTLTCDECGYVWCGTKHGLMIFDGRSTWLTPKDSVSLPECNITKIVFGNDGTRYICTDIGLYVQSGTVQSFVGAKRWLPSSNVKCVAPVSDNSEYWVGTDKGLSRITMTEMSLEEKANYYEEIINTRHNREGYINCCKYENDTPENFKVNVSDNDGLWTAVYVAAESYRYTVTGLEEARERASKSMHALIKLLYLPENEGFPARAYRRPDHEQFGNGHIEWHASKDEIGELEWKGETSSDEMVGHYYAASVYYDLVADDEEKKKISAAISRLTDHILRNNFTLCDVDGLPTTWAQWSPYELNTNDTWHNEKGVNSLEMLSFLKITYHMTGDEKYNKVYYDLIKNHHYALNTVTYKIDDNHTCHIDDKLGFLSILPLMTYEKNPQILKYYQMGLRYHWMVERVERCPTWSFIYGALTGDFCDIDNAVRTLEEYPLDTYTYRMNNSVRPEVEVDYTTELFAAPPQAKEPLPADERPSDRLTYGAWALDSENEKRHSAFSPSTWTLPYWMGRYYGILRAE